MLQAADQRNQYLTRGLYMITIKIESISQGIPPSFGGGLLLEELIRLSYVSKE